MTLTQLSAFVLVAQLGSVKAAAQTLGVSEPAVSQALTALRTQFGDQLATRDGNGMTLTAGGTRLLTIASQMVALGAEAEAAVRSAQGAPAQLRLITTNTIAEFVVTPIVDRFTSLMGGSIDVSSGVVTSGQIPAMVAHRFADVALGPYPPGDIAADLISKPVFRSQLIVVGSAKESPSGRPSSWSWLVDPSGTDPVSDTTRLLRSLRVPEDHVRVFPNQTAAWDAAAHGTGVAPATAHLVTGQLRRGELRVVNTPATPLRADWFMTTLPPDRRPEVADSMQQFFSTPQAMRLMRAPGSGVPRSRFRPPVYVTIWSWAGWSHGGLVE